MEQQTAQYIRRSLSRIGCAVLLYLLVAQLLGGMVMLIPGLADQTCLSYLVSYAVIYAAAPVVLWLMLRHLPKGQGQSLSFSPKAFLRTAVYCVGILYLFNILTTLLIAGMEAITGTSTSNLLQNLMDEMPTWFYLLLVGVVAPVGEEFVFRKLLLERLRPFGDRCAIWVSAVAFGLFHLNLYQLFYAVVAGLILAGVALKTGKLRYTIALHAIVNLSSGVLSLISETSEVATAIAGIAILAMIGVSIYLFVRYAPTFRHLPPQYPATEREVMLSLLHCPGLWVCTLVCLALSVVMIFAI